MPFLPSNLRLVTRRHCPSQNMRGVPRATAKAQSRVRRTQRLTDEEHIERLLAGVPDSARRPHVSILRHAIGGDHLALGARQLRLVACWKPVDNRKRSKQISVGRPRQQRSSLRINGGANVYNTSNLWSSTSVSHGRPYRRKRSPRRKSRSSAPSTRCQSSTCHRGKCSRLRPACASGSMRATAQSARHSIPTQLCRALSPTHLFTVNPRRSRCPCIKC